MAGRTFVFDLDGVVYRGEQPLTGAVETIEALRHHGHQVYFFTNNSTQTRTEYASKLRRMGISCDEEHIMTSGFATALYLVEKGARGATVFPIGEGGLRGELNCAGMTLVDDGIREKVDYVVVGLDREFTYEKLMKGHLAITGGAQFIATNRDATFPLEEGLVIPGGGTMVAAIETSTGVKPVVIGKPETYAMCRILDLAGASPDDAVIVGDRLDTDILAGKRIGTTTVIVLTGITSEADIAAAPPELRPNMVIHALPELLGDGRLQEER